MANAPEPTERTSPLDVCPHCGADWLEPIEFSHAGAHLWAVAALCPRCCNVIDVIVEESEIDAFERDHERSVKSLRKAIWRDP